jgi:hypothetical protein
MKWFLRIWLLVFCGIPAGFLVVGVFQIFSQKQKIDTFVSVEAVVLSSRVKTVTTTDSDGDTSTSYKPLINYSYGVNGQNYKSDIAYPLGNESASRDWANSIVRQFPKGKTVQAYYNPDQPDEAFLIRDLSYRPYLFTQAPMLFLLVGVLVVMYANWGGRPVVPPVPKEEGGFRLLPKRSLSRRRWTLFAGTVAWYSLGGLTRAIALKRCGLRVA